MDERDDYVFVQIDIFLEASNDDSCSISNVQGQYYVVFDHSQRDDVIAQRSFLRLKDKRILDYHRKHLVSGL
jgi:hypothetical protein